jgi:hypothetical protein
MESEPVKNKTMVWESKKYKVWTMSEIIVMVLAEILHHAEIFYTLVPFSLTYILNNSSSEFMINNSWFHLVKNSEILDELYYYFKNVNFDLDITF